MFAMQFNFLETSISATRKKKKTRPHTRLLNKRIISEKSLKNDKNIVSET